MLIGSSLGQMIQAATEEVTVLSVTADTNIATWTFSHPIASFTDATGLEAGDGGAWFSFGGSGAHGSQVDVEYQGIPLTQWRILQPPPGLTFVGGVPIKVPQSGVVT